MTISLCVLHNDANKGFVRSDNAGYRYCKEQLHCDYIVTISNNVMPVRNDLMVLCMECCK